MEFNRGELHTTEENNGKASITISCGDNEAVYITHVSASYDGQLSNNQRLIEILDGGDSVWRYWAYREDVKNFGFGNAPLKGTKGNDVTIELQASGENGVNGVLNVISHKGE